VSVILKETQYTLVESEQAHPDRPPPVIVHLTKFTKKGVRQAVRDLTDNAHIIYDLEGVETHLGARPVEFQVNKLRFGEYALWDLGLRAGVLNAHDVVRYVGAHLDHTKQSDDLRFCSVVDIVGQGALYAALDLYLPRSRADRLYAKDLETVIPSFVEFIERCDLDHEQFQQSYIMSTLKYLAYRDLETFARLFVYRCSHGQEYDLGFDNLHNFLYQKHALKAVVDRLLFLSLSDVELTERVLMYCAVVYGGEKELTEEVLRYCSEKASIVEEDELPQYALSRTPLYRATRDLYWLHGEKVWSIVDTGFHIYRRAENTWRKRG